MVKKITFNSDYICFFKKESFDFGPITLLVGDQGCGKSTMLQMIKDVAERSGDSSVVDAVFDDTIQSRVLLFDLEKHNPRLENFGPDDSQGMLYGLTSKFKSHGEVMLPLLKLLRENKDTIILLDEPETSLSLRSQYMMIDIFNECLKNNNQIVLATHNIVFIEAFPDNILSLEHLKYITPRKFINSQKGPSNFKMKREDKIIKKQNCRLGVACTCVETSPVYDRNCFHYVDREGKSGLQRRQTFGPSIGRMKREDFKN